MIFGYELIKPNSISILGTNASANITPNGSVEFTDCDQIDVENVFTLDFENYIVFFSFYCNENQNLLLDMITTSGTPSSAPVEGAGYYVQGTSIYSNKPYGVVAQLTYTGKIYENMVTGIACGYAEFYGPRNFGRTTMRASSATTWLLASIYDTGVYFDANEAHTGFELSSESPISGRLIICGIGGS